MGDIAEMVLDGYLCQVCGVLISDDPNQVTGYATTCDDCNEGA